MSSFFIDRKAKIEDESSLSLEPSFPWNALVELTNGCNHSCIFCKSSTQSRKIKYLSKNIYKKFMSEASNLGLKEVGLYATGEPFIIKDLDEYISIAKTYNIDRVYVTTNGVHADLKTVTKCVEAGLDSIKFSINASNNIDYLTVHGRDDFSKVVDNLTKIYQWREENNVNLQLLCSCVILPNKKDTQIEHQKVFSQFFDDICYSPAHSQGGQLFDMPFDEEFKNTVFHKHKEVNDEDILPCRMVFDRYHLTVEGYLTACCVDYNSNLAYANLNEETLQSGWLNPYITKLRKKHLEKKLDGTICHQCLSNKKLPYKRLRELDIELRPSDISIKTEKDIFKRIIAVSK